MLTATTGPLDRAAVERVIAPVAHTIERCVAPHAEPPEMAFQFIVSPNGELSFRSDESPCLRRALRRLEFPAAASRTRVILYVPSPPRGNERRSVERLNAVEPAASPR